MAKTKALAAIGLALLLGGCINPMIFFMKDPTPAEMAAEAQKNLEEAAASLPQRSSYPPAGMRDPKWEAYMLSQVRLFGTEQAKADMKGVKLAAVSACYFAAANWSPNKETHDEDIRGSDGSVLASKRVSKINGKGALIWIVGRTQAGTCLAIKGAMNLTYNGVDWEAPSIIWGPDATNVFDQSFKLPCR